MRLLLHTIASCLGGAFHRGENKDRTTFSKWFNQQSTVYPVQHGTRKSDVDSLRRSADHWLKLNTPRTSTYVVQPSSFLTHMVGHKRPWLMRRLQLGLHGVRGVASPRVRKNSAIFQPMLPRVDHM
eukprot:TRINITY_DN60621_c0_g1_i1.p2 TRINITY_DN60621_c0_g1~~TRINITY_DN60621_c0_g1_i1.p2  ORF type:complete len:126 (-),score=4.01 TRINITY_DN60621_c0_g1_i1:121-498(-)